MKGLERLLERTDEKTFLFVGEDHHTRFLKEIYDLCETFEADAIAVEARLDPDYDMVMEGARILFEEGRKERFSEKEFKQKADEFWLGRCPLPLSIAYAALTSTPLYFVDWHPFSPLDARDLFTHPSKNLSFHTMYENMEETIDIMFGENASTRAKMQGLRMMSGGQSGVPYTEELQALCSSHYGMTIRNEWTSMALDALDARRILYVCGDYHLKEIEDEPYIPIQHLVEGRRYLVRLLGNAEEEPEIVEVSERRERELDWDLIDYMEHSKP